VQKLLDSGAVTVGDRVEKKNYKVRVSDVITADIPAPKELTALPQDIPVDVVYEDDDLIVVNKPVGMVVHPAPGNPDGTLVNALLHHCSGNLSGINGVIRPGIVHRIDKDTSGLLVVCKSDTAHRSLSQQFFDHSIERTYWAIVRGTPKEHSGVIDSPIGRDPKERKRFVSGARDGKRAVTGYEVLESFSGYSLVKLNLQTGRTHQIRVHMSGIGHPLAGDWLYGGREGEFGLVGQCLHAKSLGFVHPISNEFMQFDSQLPQHFQKVLDNLRR